MYSLNKCSGFISGGIICTHYQTGHEFHNEIGDVCVDLEQKNLVYTSITKFSLVKKEKLKKL